MSRTLRSLRATRHSSLATVLFSLLTYLVACLVPPNTSAQVQPGTPPLGSFGGGPDIINLGNNNAHWSISVLHKPGRGTNFTYDLGYDSSVWYPVTSGSTTTWTPVTNWGWRGVTQMATGYISYQELDGGQCQDSHGQRYFERSVIGPFVYHDPFGVSHLFVGRITVITYPCTPSGGSLNTVAADGSGFTIQATAQPGPSVSATLYGSDGKVVGAPLNTSSGSATTTDRNGNQITADNSGHFYDTLSSTTPVLTVSGSGTPSSPMIFTYAAPSGASASYAMKYTNYSIETNFGCSGTGEYGSNGTTTANLVSEIDLPNGSKYTLSYEPTPGHSGFVTGRLASVTLATGGTISYSYSGGNNGIVCADGSAATLTRTTPDGTWTYARTQVSGNHWQTTITDPTTPTANQTVIDFEKDSALTSTNNFYETQRQIYQGSSTSGTLLQTLVTCYNGNASNCTTTAVATPTTRRTVTMQFPGGKQSKTDTFINGYGLPTEFDEYDYGSGAPGALLRKTLTSYASLGNNIVGRPATVTIQDGSGNTKAQVGYGYDQSAVTATSGAPQHSGISGSRGNLTTVSRLVQGTTNLNRTYVYYDTGNTQTLTDTNGTVTTYNYSSTGSCGNSFVTSLSMPLGLSRTMAWNCVGAVITSVTDENGQIATTSFTDAYYWRPASVADGQSNTTNFTYTGANISESVLLFNGGQSAQDVLTTLDGLGRPKLSQLRQAPGSANFDSVEIDYDALGHPYRTTIPYVGTSGQTNPSGPATVNLYDPLQRVTQTTDGGGGVLSKTYTQNDTLRVLSPAPIGENTKRKQLEFDGLGRLTSVCEITSASGSGSCAQTSSQTGYWTTYTYDTLGDLTGVTQNAQGTSMQTRSFVFDMLGRMTSETNPETGTTTYTFDSASGCSGTSNGDLIKKVDAVGNTSCYAYDALHRITSITYSGSYAANTPNKYFVYDSATVNGVAMTNAKTRLAEAYTATCSTCTKISDTGYSYGARGDVSDVYESTPNSGGYYHLTSTYWPNREVNQMSGLPGLPAMTYGVDGEGRGYSVTANSGQNPVQSTLYNVFEEPTSVTFGSADADSFMYDPNTGRVTQYKFTVNGQSVFGNLTWNQNRTLSALSITDPFNSANTQNCAYLFDDLKRLASGNCGAVWSQTFGYDPFGNITMSGNGTFQPTYSSATNRFTSLPGFTPTYDANGNLLSDSAHTYTWNVDGRPVSIDSVSITYDAMGRMVEQNRSGTYTQIVYTPTGSKLALMNGQSLSKAYVSLPSGATAVYTSSGLSYYRHADWLGSSRLASTTTRTIYSDSAYSPFGQSYAQYGSTDVAFTGQNQDTASGLYDFPAREYAPFQGRWLSPDPVGIHSVNPMNPKTWNRYAYALNNPLSMIDPNGECSQPAGLQPGQIGVCIDLYIASPTVGVGACPVFCGLGDNRGPVGNDPNASYRVEYSIIYDPQNGFATRDVTTSPSHVEILGLDASSTGDTTGPVDMVANSDGSVTVSIDTASVNGFADFSMFGAPADPILLDMSLTISPDGTVSIDGGERSAFPSIEAWTYQSGQDPFNLLAIQETKESDLGSFNQEIPDVSNDPSNASAVVTGADGSDGEGDSGGGGGGGGGGDAWIPDEGDEHDDEALLIDKCEFRLASLSRRPWAELLVLPSTMWHPLAETICGINPRLKP